MNRARGILIACLIGACFPAAYADVVLQRKTILQGLMGMGNSQLTEMQYIKGDKSYIESVTEFTGGLMMTVTKGQPTTQVQIIRLDKKLTWNLDPANKTYTELPFFLMRQNLEELKEAMADSAKSADEDRYDWKVKVDKSTQREKIGDFDCRSALATAVGVNRKNPADTVTISYQSWFAENVPGQTEIEQFQREFAKAMEVDEYATLKGLQQWLPSYGKQFARLAEGLSTIKGFPVKTVISISSSVTQSEKPEEPEIDQEELPDSLQGMMSQLRQLMGQKKQAVAGAKKEPLFSVASEIISVNVRSVEDKKFEVPSDYRKLK